ncbi:uncharacterized protein LOC112199106 [Rosa chinensis]|uniref:uncharacterized protein LOC112199106 n=1 Tax=Rosa chinensis TaxID=74649 RepID=UPI000D096848|nr:uncharacterized protein LOC112199106 [Rosa chinensis]
MGQKKGGPPPPRPPSPPPPPSSSLEFPPLPSHPRSSSSSLHQDLNPLELDFQLHRDQTSANFQDIKESLEYMHFQNFALRSKLLEEIRQLRVGPKNPCEVAGTSQVGGLPSLRLSSFPKTSSLSPPALVLPPVSLVSSALGNFHTTIPDLSILPLYSSFMTGSMNGVPNTHMMSMELPNLLGSMVSLPMGYSTGMTLSSGPLMMEPVSQFYSAPQYFHMPNISSQPHYVAHNIPLPHPQSHQSSFNLTYSGPYPVSYIDFMPTTSQLCSQAPPYFPNLPTMKQMHLDFTTFDGGDHVDCVDYQVTLAKLQQVGSVADYKARFTKLSCRAPRFSPGALLACFIGGLKEDIRVDVRDLNPKTLLEAYELAKIYEEKYVGHKHQFISAAAKSIPNISRPANSTSLTPKSSTRTPLVVNKNELGHNKLTQAENQERRAKNICFFCEEPFKPSHNCRKGRAFLIEVCSGDEVNKDNNAIDVTDELVSDLNKLDEPLIQLHAMLGEHSETMQLKGEIGHKRQVHVLIDSRASHYFIHPSVLKKGKLLYGSKSPLNVKVASGAIMQTMGHLPSFQMTLQGYTFQAEFYVLPVSSCEVTLGASWLQSLGDILWNFEDLTMKFDKGALVILYEGYFKRNLVLSRVECLASNDTPQNIPAELTPVLKQFEQVFSIPTSLPPHRSHDHRIVLAFGTAPINFRPYMYVHYQKNEIDKIVKDLQESGVVRPSNNPFSSPVLLVKKKDGIWRLCADYRSLNAATIKDNFSIPMVDKLLDEVHGAIVFSKLDLRSGYHQIRMRPEDIEKTAFRTHEGHYKFLVMPFGLTNAPSTFQALMNDVFKEYLRKFVLVFFDDILIYSSSMEEHGHVVSSKGVAVDPSKIESISQWQKPTTLKGLRGFLGFAGYYRKFVRNFGIIAKPLTNMLKKDNFKWSKEADKAFEELKRALISTPVLALLDFSKEFTVKCDASSVGIG